MDAKTYGLRNRHSAQIQFLISSAVDISERKQAEKALRKQNERLRLLWETAGILFSTDNYNYLTLLNCRY